MIIVKLGCAWCDPLKISVSVGLFIILTITPKSSALGVSGPATAGITATLQPERVIRQDCKRGGNIQ